MTKVFHKIKYGLLCSAMACAIPLAQAADPVVNTTIAVDKTGTEPWDTTTWNGADLNTAGTDEGSDNDVVRLQDTITYKVEVSVNDSDVDDLVAVVYAVNGQVWRGIPSGCQTKAADVTSQPVSSITDNGTKLFCNLGPAIEGTTKVFRPAARTTGVDPKNNNNVILNDTVVQARVEAGADGNNNMASAGPVDTIVTANFKVDLIKELKVSAVDPNTNKPLYAAPAKKGPNGEDGVIIEYVIKAKYAKGSMIADGADEVNGDFTASYTLVDVYTDDNSKNNPPGKPLSTGGVLYTWDGNTGCELTGDHGAGAAVTCSAIATIDEMGPVGGAADGLQDGTIEIDLSNIDVRDPDADGNLFEIRLSLWFNKATEIDKHDTCTGNNAGKVCTNTVTNRVGLLPANATALTPFDEAHDPNIVSTEDAGGNNLPNYNAGNEPYPNEISYPLIYPAGVSYSMHKSFSGIWPHATQKLPDQNMAPGETRPFLLDVFDYRLIDGAKTQGCDKIDTEVFEYQGVAPPNQIANPPLYLWNNNKPHNPALYISGPGGAGLMLLDGSDYIEFYYSNKAHAPAGATQPEYLEALRTNECNDDVNGDGVVNIVDKNGVESNPGNPIDWWQNAADVPGGMAAITLMRQDTRYDAAMANATFPGHERFAILVNHLIKAKDGQLTSPYGSNNRLPNFASRRADKGDGNFSNWLHAATNTTDPNDDTNFSIASGTVDRMTLIASSQSLQKYTDPLNTKVVRGGDKVDFILKPQVLGQWDSNVVDTATLNDDLPIGTTYVAGSEQFSVDGGATWLSRTDYDASTPAVTITSAAHASSADPLVWDFGSVDAGEQLPLVKYSVLVDPTAVSGQFINVSTLNSGSIGNDQTATAPYIIRILPQSGLDVKKTVDKAVYSINTPFTYNLIYKNLGGEDYASGEFIDIFPFNGDGGGNTGGLASAREPATIFNGSYQLTGITAANGETFWATDAPPASIPQDVCHEDNQAQGYTPSAGDLCYAMYINNGNKFAGGGTAGTGAITWTACAGTDCSAVANATAVRFTTPAIPNDGGGKTVSIELDPIGNRGGTPDLDADGNVTDDSTGDIYTNNFGGRVPEISLPVISNDVSVTMVAGSIGDYVWLDANGDGVQDAGEAPIEGTELALLDGAGNPIYVDANGNVVPAGTPNAVPYTTTTGPDGKYLFENLPDGDYQVKVTNLPLPSLEQTFDANGALDNTSSVTLNTIADPITGELTGIDNNSEQDFGYQQLGSIGDTIYHDINNDGVIDANEGLGGVTVTLTPPAGVNLGNGPGQPITTTTNSDGTYLFENLPEGDYTVSVDESDLPAELQGNNTQDPDGGTPSESAVSLSAGEQNLDQDFGYYAPPPINADDDAYTTTVDTPVAITPLTNDTPGTTITEINGVTLTGNTQSIPVPNGTVEIDAAGNMTFVPNPGYTGSAVFPYKISDGTNTATAEVTVTIDPAPITASDDVYTTPVNTPVAITPLANDTAGTSITEINGVKLTGSAQSIPVPNGTVEIDTAGNMTFVPNSGYTGSAVFPYTIADANGNTAKANVTVTITALPIAANNDFYTTPIDTPVAITPLVNDTAGTRVTEINGVTLTGSAQSIPVPNGTVEIDAAGNMTFVPNPGYTGSAVFPYTISDGTNTATANVTVTIDPAPIAASDDVYTTPVDTPVAITPLVNDTAGTRVTEINGVTLTGSTQSIPVPNGTVEIDAAGNMTFVPNPGYTGSAVFPYVISDNNGNTAAANVTVTIDPAAITATDDVYTTPVDTPVPITPLVNDTAGTRVTEINGVTLTGSTQSIPVPNGTVEIDAAGNMTFVPNPGYTGSAVFPYVISDNNGNTATANVTVTIEPIAATDDFYTSAVDTPVPITLLGNDTPGARVSEINGVPLTGGAQSIPVPNGTVNIDAAGNMVFVPSPGYTGLVTFPYTISDANGNTAAANVNINIPGSSTPEPIPSSSIWSLLLLVGLMGLFASRRRQQA